MAPALETVEKPLRAFPTRGLQPAARTHCPLLADNLHTCGLEGIFSDVHAAEENDLTSFAAYGRRTLRGFFTLKRRGHRPRRFLFRPQAPRDFPAGAEFCKQVDFSPGCGKAAPPPGDNREKALYFREFPGGWLVDKAVETGDNSQLSTGRTPVICKIMSTSVKKSGQSNGIPPQLKSAHAAVSHLPSQGPAAILNNP